MAADKRNQQQVDPFTEMMFGPPPRQENNARTAQPKPSQTGGSLEGLLGMFTKPDGTIDYEKVTESADQVMKIAEQLGPILQKAAPLVERLLKKK